MSRHALPAGRCRLVESCEVVASPRVWVCVKPFGAWRKSREIVVFWVEVTRYAKVFEAAWRRVTMHVGKRVFKSDGKGFLIDGECIEIFVLASEVLEK